MYILMIVYLLGVSFIKTGCYGNLCDVNQLCVKLAVFVAIYTEINTYVDAGVF